MLSNDITMCMNSAQENHAHIQKPMNTLLEIKKLLILQVALRNAKTYKN